MAARPRRPAPDNNALNLVVGISPHTILRGLVLQFDEAVVSSDQADARKSGIASKIDRHTLLSPDTHPGDHPNNNARDP